MAEGTSPASPDRPRADRLPVRLPDLRARWARLWRRRWPAVVAGVLLGLLGAWGGVALAGPASSTVGPLSVQTQILPRWGGGTVVALPPLGAVRLPTHRGPVQVDATVTGVDLSVAQRWISGADDPQLSAETQRQVLAALRAAAVRAAVSALVGGVLLTLVVTRRRASVLAATATVGVLVAASALATAATYQPGATHEPTFTGALVNAPKVVGDLAVVPANLTRYGTELAGLVDNLTRVVHAVDSVPLPSGVGRATVIVHISDVHLAVQAWPLVKQVAATYHADAVVDTGDVADHGTAVENAALAPIATLGVPYVYVKGNHDSATTVAAIAAMPNATVLQDSAVTIGGITIAGAGDPRFTPDKTTRSEGAAGDAQVLGAAERLRGFVGWWDTTHPGRSVDVVASHDPLAAGVLDGSAPTLLFGHVHTRETWLGTKGSRICVEGSTGGAGLRALQGETPTPVELSVLYFSPTTGRLIAFDAITLGGLGATSADVQRVVVAADGTTPVDAVPAGQESAAPPLPPAARQVRPGRWNESAPLTRAGRPSAAS